MGVALSLGKVKRVKVATRKGKVVLIEDSDVGNDRRRNSLAYNLESYVKLNGSDPNELLHEIENQLKLLAPEIKGTDRIKKVPKFTKIGNNILHGNIRELKTQVIMHFNQINRRYKDFTHNGNAMLHFICQEVRTVLPSDFTDILFLFLLCFSFFFLPLLLFSSFFHVFSLFFFVFFVNVFYFFLFYFTFCHKIFFRLFV